MAAVIQRPTGKRGFIFDYSKFPEIVAGDTLTGTPTVTAVESADMNNRGTTPPTVGTPAIAGATVTVAIGPGGTDGVKYTLTCSCNTAAGAVLVIYAELQVSTRVLT